MPTLTKEAKQVRWLEDTEADDRLEVDSSLGHVRLVVNGRPVHLTWQEKDELGHALLQQEVGR